MKEFKFFQKPEPLCWVGSMGLVTPISEMSAGHVYNICTLLKGRNVIPNPYHGKTNDEWLYIFEEELKNRFLR